MSAEVTERVTEMKTNSSDSSQVTSWQMVPPSAPQQEIWFWTYCHSPWTDLTSERGQNITVTHASALKFLPLRSATEIYSIYRLRVSALIVCFWETERQERIALRRGRQAFSNHRHHISQLLTTVFPGMVSVTALLINSSQLSIFFSCILK